MSERDQARAAKLLLEWARLMEPMKNTLGPEVRHLVERTIAFNDISQPEPATERPR
jgi:hypothetical protein